MGKFTIPIDVVINFNEANLTSVCFFRKNGQVELVQLMEHTPIRILYKFQR